MDYNNMTYSEMIDYLENNPGRKVTHHLFAPGEYIWSNGFVVYTEEGYMFDDLHYINNGLKIRKDGLWSDGWSVIKE